ncbi:NTPase KAP [Pseudomonas sp. TH03]|uniref:P-loop NTPase fold protein n=1 Tax=Pseudomonas sp. TH03 TaxID=2796369 RepID=UPI001912BC86|nr:P-loop NTPase fold protein [Pseudomonas sp. TH03]MBK5551926.1 NTPase KAP [Pseudomonas sp. TH03]
MSLKSTKEQLAQLLMEKDNKVIALSGKWGTGKSYMWDQVKASSGDDMVKGALYASLFGLSGMEQVKMKLIQSAVPAIEANPGLWAGAKQTLKVLEGFHKGFGAINDLSLVFAPAILRQKLIVLDDIERKHDKLNIDEVLGFIDEFTQQHDSRFVLILNSDQLAKRDVWDTLREKVVDQELRLTTSASEAFDIAIELTDSDYAEQIRATVESCGLTNIRIIRKVIKAVNRILGDRQELSDAVLWRVIPSTVLLAAIHYKGIEDGPDFNFVLTQGAGNIGSMLGAKKVEEETEESKQKSRWRLLMSKLKISQCDDFELLVVEFLQSGLFDVSQVAIIIDRYVAEADVMNTRHAAHQFFERSVWDHTLTETQLLTDAIEITSKSHLMDAHMVSSLCEIISELPGGQVVADEAVCRWITAFQLKNPDGCDFPLFFHDRLHPRIQAEFDAAKAVAQAKTSVYDACLYVAEHNGWGSRQVIAFQSATVQDMETIIREGAIPEMRFFMAKMLDLCINKETYEQHFGLAMDNYIHACKSIAQDPQSGRLGKLVKRLFIDSKLESLLEPVPPTTVVSM